jgi:hypothetical protein
VAGLFILKHMDGSNYRFLEQREAARDGKGHLERWIVALVRFFLGLCAGSHRLRDHAGAACPLSQTRRRKL